MRGFFVTVLMVMAASGCSRTFKKSVTQPNPLANPAETLRISEKITIVTGDMELTKPAPAENGYTSQTTRASVERKENPASVSGYPLINQASFTVVSKDRLRFHVQLDHKWEEWADLHSWEVELVDDQGRRWVPESIEHARVKIMTSMWDYEQRSTICSSAGRDGGGNCYNTIGFEDDGWKRRQPLGTLSVFRGKADFVFYQRDLFNAGVKSLRLIVKRPEESFQFTWNFRDTVAND